jgi:DNA-binding NtrC family response regulator
VISDGGSSSGSGGSHALPLETARRTAEEGRRGAVLIVEDERVARRALAMLLASSGYVIRAVGSAEEALNILEGGGSAIPPQVALVDLNLPGMNGLDFISRLEKLEPAVFPVLMTAAGEETVGDAVRERHLMYLRKPLDVSKLLTVITHGEQRP